MISGFRQAELAVAACSRTTASDRVETRWTLVFLLITGFDWALRGVDKRKLPPSATTRIFNFWHSMQAVIQDAANLHGEASKRSQK